MSFVSDWPWFLSIDSREKNAIRQICHFWFDWGQTREEGSHTERADKERAMEEVRPMHLLWDYWQQDSHSTNVTNVFRWGTDTVNRSRWLARLLWEFILSLFLVKADLWSWSSVIEPLEELCSVFTILIRPSTLSGGGFAASPFMLSLSWATLIWQIIAICISNLDCHSSKCHRKVSSSSGRILK